nr:hypothetical protein BaRGS_017151 [Batillaria attramentaria]
MARTLAEQQSILEEHLNEKFAEWEQTMRSRNQQNMDALNQMIEDWRTQTEEKTEGIFADYQEKLEDRMNDTLTDLGMVLADQNQRSRDAVDEKFEDWKTEFRQMYTEELVDFQARLEERTYGNLSQVQASLELVKQELDATQGLFRMDDNSILAFRLTAGTDSSAYGRYTSVGYNDDHPMVHAGWNCGCRSVDGILPCNRHYRSRFLDLWPSSLIDTVNENNR